VSIHLPQTPADTKAKGERRGAKGNALRASSKREKAKGVRLSGALRASWKVKAKKAHSK
jgi:hypothetical protein